MASDVPERPVRIIKRHLACENTKLRVYFDHIASPTGFEVERFMVVSLPGAEGDAIERPLQHPTGITVLPVRDGEIGLLRVFRHPIGDWVWESPRGFIDHGETAHQAALRELTEETGLIGTPAGITDLGFLYPEPGVIRGQGHLFAVTGCRPDGKAETEEEIGIGHFQWFPLEMAFKMVMTSEILESHTCVSIMRYYHQQQAKA